MHKSKLGGFIIDCRTDDLSAAAAFWSAALGMPVLEPRGGQPQAGTAETYRALHDAQHGLDTRCSGSSMRAGCIWISKAYPHHRPAAGEIDELNARCFLLESICHCPCLRCPPAQLLHSRHTRAGSGGGRRYIAKHPDNCWFFPV